MTTTSTEEPTTVLPDTLPLDFPHIPIGHPDTMMSVESVRRAVEEFRVRPSDIIVATFSKTGTTLVTWICHLLRTKGSTEEEEFETLYEVVPWPLLSYDIGYDPNTAGSQFQPRVFKSHLRMASIYRGCKYIVTIRDPIKTTLSFYNFLVAKGVEMVTKVDVSTFLLETPFVKGREGRASLWEFYQEYHLLRDCENVLIVVYEDLIQENKPLWIKLIAKFMGLEDCATPEVIQKVVEKSSKEYMAERNTLFDEPYERAKELGRVGDLSQLAPGAKVVVQPHTQQLNEQAQQFLQDQWNQTMKPLGYDDYEDLKTKMRERNERLFDMKLTGPVVLK